jgi:hypothetical protein
MYKNETEQLEQLNIRNICEGKLCKSFFEEVTKYFNSKNMNVHLLFASSLNHSDLFEWVAVDESKIDEFKKQWEQAKIESEKEIIILSREEKEIVNLVRKTTYTLSLERKTALAYGNNLTFNYENIEDVEDFKELTLSVLF